MLTATETQRVKNFTSGMDPETSQAMFRLFEMTKPGCTRFANALFMAAHTGEQVSCEHVSSFVKAGLIYNNGYMPRGVRNAIRKAVAERYFIIHHPLSPVLRPDDLSDLALN